MKKVLIRSLVWGALIATVSLVGVACRFPLSTSVIGSLFVFLMLCGLIGFFTHSAPICSAHAFTSGEKVGAVVIGLVVGGLLYGFGTPASSLLAEAKMDSGLYAGFCFALGGILLAIGYLGVGILIATGVLFAYHLGKFSFWHFPRFCKHGLCRLILSG